MVQVATYSIAVGGVEMFTQDDEPTIGFTIKASGNRSSQSATITLGNQGLGTLWASTFPARQPITITIDGVIEFDGAVDHIAAPEGYPGSIVVECAGRTMRLRDSEVRPIVRDEALDEDERDSGGVVASVSGGQIQVPMTPGFSPIDQVISVTIAAEPILVLNADLANGILYVDPKYNGSTAIVSYTAFKAKYEAATASSIVLDLVARHGAAQGITANNVDTVATTLTFEPSRTSNLLAELGRIRDILGGAYDFFLDADNDLHFFQRSGSSVATLDDTAPYRFHSASFSVDYSAYANKVTARAGSATTNSIAPRTGPFSEALEQTTQPNGIDPGSSAVSQAAQGFKALDSAIESFKILAKRQGEGDIIDWEVQYNGSTAAILEDFSASHSTTPDSVNISLVAASNHIHVKANAIGTAYFSNEWAEDLNQDVENTTSTITTTSNIYQTVTVADLARTSIKGIAFKTASTANSVVFKIYDGTAGNTGTLLGTSEAVPLGANDHEQETDWFAVYFIDPVDVSGSTNISIVPNTDASTFLWQRNSTTVYAGGAASAGGDFTFQFFTVKEIQDMFAALAIWTETVAVANKTPRYYVARDYDIGNTVATWVEVVNNAPAIVASSGAAQDKFGIKVEFNSGSLTTDPLVSEIQGNVAYADAGEALDWPSGILVGNLFGSIESGELPFFNADTGSFTNEIQTDQDTRLAPNGNYWLVLHDGNLEDNGASYFTIFYDDGASATFTEPWSGTTNVGSSTDLTVSDSQATIARNKKFASMLSTNLFTTTNAITAARIAKTETLRSAKVLSMLARNRRNYYDPERSTDITKPAMNTGEICILQFDAGDTANVNTTLKKVVDQTGNGFDSLIPWSSITASGKYGSGLTTGATLGITQGQGIAGLAQWLMGDASFAFHYKPTAALADGKTLFALYDGTRVNLRAGTKASGELELTWTYANGVSTQTNTTDGTNSATVMVNGTFIHVTIKRTGYSSISVYFNNVLKNTFTITNLQDTVFSSMSRGAVVNAADFILTPTSGFALGGPPTGIVDELRIWPRVVEDWVVDHVATYAYRDIGAKFTFPTEADATDTYTDTATAADGVLKNLRVAQFLWPAPFYEDGIMLRAAMNHSNYSGVTANIDTNDLLDLSSYAHIGTSHSGASGQMTTTTNVVSGGAVEYRLDFVGADNEALRFTNDDDLHFRTTWGFLAYVKQDSLATQQTVLHKRNEVEIEVRASTTNGSVITVTMECPGGVTRTTSASFSTLAGTATQFHLGVTYDGQYLRFYQNGSLSSTYDFGSVLPVVSSTNDLFIGAENTTGTTRANGFDGKLDEVILTNYAPSATDIAALDNDESAGLRTPVQTQYIAAAYDGAATKAYTDGKYLVCRDMTGIPEEWVNTLDGTNSNPDGTLSMVITFGKDEVQAIARDATEIARAGIEVGKVFDVNATDLETLRTVAAGYLAMLKDGLAKGQITIDGRVDLEVGDIVTVDYPIKGQVDAEYAVAALETIVAEGAFRTTIQLGEEERAFATLFGKSEVGIL